MWLNDKLIVIVVCCLSCDVFVLGKSLRKRDVSSANHVDKKLVNDRNDSSSGDWDDFLGNDNDDNFASSLGESSTDWNKDTDERDEDSSSSLESGNDSNKTTKGTGSGLSSESGSKKKKQTNDSNKKKNKKENNSTNGTKNHKDTNSNHNWSSDLGTEDDSKWPNDQAWDQTSSPSKNSTSGKNTTSSGNANSTDITNWLNGISDQGMTNDSHNGPSSSTNNLTSAENVTIKIPHQNITSTEKPPSTTTSTPGTKYSTGYWIPIFNFGNDFYFMTNKGYAKLVNFPAPVIYSFMPISLRMPNFKPTGGHLRQEEEEFIGNFFENESSFADCYINSNIGNLIPYSYFGNWVAVFNLQNGWHLQTYSGFVPLDLTREQAPVTYEFDPIVYQYTTAQSASTTQTVRHTGHDAGLASWSEPVVVEN